MSGFIIPIVPKRVLDFSSVAVSSSQSVIIADRIDLLHWRGISLVLKVYSHTLTSGTGTIRFDVMPQSWTSDDPGMTFLASASAQSITIGSTTKNPDYLLADVNMSGPGCMSAMAQIVATCNRISVGSLTAQISVDFSVRDY